MIDWYDAPTGREAMLRFGPETGPVMVAASPLFEEANRTRAFVVTILRELAARGVAGALPDLPGQGDSLLPTEAVSLSDIRAGYRSATAHLGRGGRPSYPLAVRSGALLDVFTPCFRRWHLTPQDGAALLRELTRVQQAATRRGSGRHGLLQGVVDHPPEIAGHRISARLLAELPAAAPFVRDEGTSPLRTVRLEGDPRPADRHYPGPPPWRRAEPGNDPALAALLADDIAEWLRACDD